MECFLHYRGTEAQRFTELFDAEHAFGSQGR
jgi:hypothetical protein